jgi:hypothetical protein
VASAAVAVGVMAGLTADVLAAWVAASCVEQGLSVKVSDPVALRRVGVLMGAAGTVGQPRRGGGRARRSQPPDRPDPAGVEPSGAGRGTDHGVVEQRGDDGSLPIEVERGPLCA